MLNELKSSKANVDYLIDNQENFKKQQKWYEEQITMRDPVKNAEAQSARQVELIKQEFGGIIEEQNKKIDSQNKKIDDFMALLQNALGIKEGKE